MQEREPKRFLEEKYPNLHQSEEVENAVKRQEARQQEAVGQQPEERIQAYLKRLSEAFHSDDPEKRDRKVGILKDKLHELFIIKPDEIPESYFDRQKKTAREQGHGDIEITDEIRSEASATIIHDQTQSLDAWVDYLGSSDATYPDWFKYFVFRSITKLSAYDKEKKEFRKRSKGTVAPFPDINREALAYVADAVTRSKKESNESDVDREWQELLETTNFGKLYVYAIEKIHPASEEDKESVEGEWVKYEQGSDAETLFKSLQNHGTGWCTAGEGTARAQLELGDFHVFYTKNSQRENVPRVAIRMQDGEIAEIRGVGPDQNLDPVMAEANVVQDKIRGLPGAEKYEKKTKDMKQLSGIENTIGNEQELTMKELEFLYEIHNSISGFGYERDPRIQELRGKRDQRNDLVLIFNCKPEQVAVRWAEVSDKTLVYAGDINPFNEGEGTLRDKFKVPKNLMYILGDTRFAGYRGKDLGNIQVITGNAFFQGSQVESLGHLKRIGGTTNLREYYGDLGELQDIGGDALLPDDREKFFSKHKIKIGGRIR